MNRFFLIGRLMKFRNELVLLWRAFFHPATPLYLKGAMVAVVLYLVSPLDILPDFLPLLGIVDDVALIAFAVGWIARRLPPDIGVSTRRAGKSSRARPAAAEPIAGDGIPSVRCHP